jgi:TolA-binding protein
MKRLVCVIGMALMFWPGCSTEQRAANQNESKQAEAAKQERQMYQDKIEARLRELDQEIDALKKDIGTKSKADRKQLDRETADLERKREAAHQQLKELQDSGQAAWGDVKVGIDAALRDLETAYHQAASRFK